MYGSTVLWMTHAPAGLLSALKGNALALGNVVASAGKARPFTTYFYQTWSDLFLFFLASLCLLATSPFRDICFAHVT